MCGAPEVTEQAIGLKLACITDMLQTQTLQSRASAPHSPAAGQLQTVVRTALACGAHSSRNRRHAQELVWQWVGAKWPRLVPPGSDMELPQFERAMHDHAVRVTTSKDGRTWSLAVMHSEKRGRRLWTTRAEVTDTGHADLLGVQTACSEVSHAPLVVAPPRILGAWVDQMALDDGGYAVLGTPRQVSELPQREAFCAHVLSERRSLPIIALTHKALSRHFGVDPGGLALAVRGLAHVACLSPEVAAAVPAALGPGSGLVHGTARIFAPGFHDRSPHERHPLLRDKRAAGTEPGDDPGSFRRLMVRHVCAMGVKAAGDRRGPAH